MVGRVSRNTRHLPSLIIIYLEIQTCGEAGDIGNIVGRPIVRKVIGGDFARVGAWPWHAVVTLHRETVTEVS